MNGWRARIEIWKGNAIESFDTISQHLYDSLDDQAHGHPKINNSPRTKLFYMCTNLLHRPGKPEKAMKTELKQVLKNSRHLEAV